MEIHKISALAGFLLLSGLLLVCGFCYWRYVWFFRNPPRTPPPGDTLLSPADGNVVYVEVVAPAEEVISIKQGLSVAVNDIVREHLAAKKVLIGIFMSPFDVHYNRAPLSGTIHFIRHYPAVPRNRHMGAMHFRTVFGVAPFFRNSFHIVQNERTVTRIDGHFRGRKLACYVIQIAGGSVRGIDSYVEEGGEVERGTIFGMIRIGSQVDMVVPYTDGMKLMVRTGQRVRAGETVLIQ
jgi:phosphatidylserine decarboxylase